MSIVPIEERAGTTFSVPGSGVMDGVRLSDSNHTSSSPTRAADINGMSRSGLEEDDYLALINDEKRRDPSSNEGDGSGWVGAGNASHTTSENATHSPIPSGPSVDAGADISDSSIPVGSTTPAPPKHAFRSLMEEKTFYLNKIELLQQRYTGRRMGIDSSLEELKYEYDRLRTQADTAAAIKFQRRILMAVTTGIEWLNSRFNPLGLKLSGWSESVFDDIESYNDVFAKLGEKYGGAGAEISPEMSLIFMILGSAMMYHLSSSLFKSVLPN
eukprot:4943904-Pleurochrysis_carterae.AAC.1